MPFYTIREFFVSSRISIAAVRIHQRLRIVQAIAPLLALTGLIWGGRADAGTTLSMKALNVSRPSASDNPTMVIRSGGPSNVALPSGGGFIWDIVSVSGPPIDFRDIPAPYAGPSRDILTFCLQLTESFTWNSIYNPVAVKDLSQAPDAPVALTAAAIGMIKWLWQDNYNSIFAQSTEALRDLYAGAFQLAIWEIEYDNLNAGDVTSAMNTTTNKLTTNNRNQTIGSQNLFDLTRSWITSAKNKYNSLGDKATVKLVALSKANFQDQIVELEPPIIIVGDPVPEPASMAVWLVVGAALVVPVARRRRAS